MIETYLLINERTKKHPFLLIIFSLIILLIVLFSRLEAYSSIPVTGLMDCEETTNISFTLPYNQVDKITNQAKLYYKNKEYFIESISFDEPYLDHDVPYQDINIQTNMVCEEKIINFKIMYNKQRILTKMKQIILEGE